MQKMHIYNALSCFGKHEAFVKMKPVINTKQNDFVSFVLVGIHKQCDVLLRSERERVTTCVVCTSICILL